MTLDDLRTWYQVERGLALDRLTAQRARCWPAVSDRQFDALLNTVGDCSVDEVIAALDWLQRKETETR